MIHTVAISNYRSLRDIVLPLGTLSVVTGGNGTGKSSIYKALRLLADIADDHIISSLAEEGGFENVLWAGPETISRDMRAGVHPIQGTVRKHATALKLGFGWQGGSYAVDLGMPSPAPRSLFNRDPEIKLETLWKGGKPTRKALIAGRAGRAAWATVPAEPLRTDMHGYESIVRHLTGPNTPWELLQLREGLGQWRFYDHFRTDRDAPARKTVPGIRTLALSPDGRDLAAAVQTIFEIGDGEALQDAIGLAFEGAKLAVEAHEGIFRLTMQQRGMLRPLDVHELSDGTLRFLLLATAILSPRPAPLLVLNEPEASLHEGLIPILAGLIRRASEDSQLVVVSHNRTLVSSLLVDEAELIELRKDCGETFADVGARPAWSWPKR